MDSDLRHIRVLKNNSNLFLVAGLALHITFQLLTNDDLIVL